MLNKKSSAKISISLMVIGVAGLLLFQNCGAPPQVTNQESDDPNKLYLYGDEVPFAFKTSINQLSYMSCTPGATASTEAFYTFAFNSSDAFGVTLTNEIFDYAYNNFRSFTSGKIAASKIKELIQNSSSNVGTQLQFAVRPFNWAQFPNSALSADGGVEVTGLDLVATQLSISSALDQVICQYLFFNKTNAAKADIDLNCSKYNLSTGTSYVNYLSSSAIANSDRKFYGKINLTNFNKEQFTNDLQQNNALLALTYSLDLSQADNQADSYARVPSSYDPENENITMSGSAFQFSFSRVGGESNALQTITELDLSKDDRISNKTWACDFRLKIFSFKDKSLCAGQIPPNAPSSSASQAEVDLYKQWEIVKAHLNLNYWNVNLSSEQNGGCIVPSSDKPELECYPNRSLGKQVGYNTAFGTESCGENQDCPNYITICYRK